MTRLGAMPAAGILALLLTAGHVQAACTPVPQEKIGFQLYNMLAVMIPRADMPAAVAGGPVTISPRTLDATLSRLHAIGFRNMEGLGDRLPAPLAAYKALLSKDGLVQDGSHRPLDPARWSAGLISSDAGKRRVVSGGTAG